MNINAVSTEDPVKIKEFVWEFFKNKFKSSKWIKVCLESSSVSVLVNGSPTREFKMEKGLRQGDPMAPFLFLVVAKCLNVLMLDAKEKGLFD